MTLLAFLEPNIFSPLGTLVFVLVALCYWRGLRALKRAGRPVAWWRVSLFYVCWGLAYIALETQFDYFAQFIFFMHRLQHLLLHHLLAFLLAVSRPFGVLNAGLGPRFPRHWLVCRLLARLVRSLMHPLVASVIFVGLIVFWLYPPVHLASMLNYPLYVTMNWSMLVDGLLFWPVMLDERLAARLGAAGYGKRLVGLFITLVVQVIVGALITFNSGSIYDIYTVCGRPWPIAPATDQTLGGVLTWIPPAMMAIVAILIVMYRYLKQDEARASRFREARRRASNQQA